MSSRHRPSSVKGGRRSPFKRGVVGRRGVRTSSSMNEKARQEWEEVVAKLPRHLEALLGCEAFGRGPGREPPPLKHGVYLFTDAGRPLYVGRCGLTERAARKGA